MSLEDVFAAYPDLDFVEQTEEEILQQMVRDYEEKFQLLTGEQITLEPGDPERILLSAQAYRYYQAMVKQDRLIKMNLLKYASGGYLDNLGASCKVYRLPAQSAVTTVKFTLSKAQAGQTVIPAGIRVSGGPADGKEVFFATTEELVISPGSLEGAVGCRCTSPGAAGNGYTPGQIKVLVDPLPYVSSVANTDTSAGGSDVESDGKLKERIYYRPDSFSVAGPEDAYRYYALSYSQAISDVHISSPEPGKVDVRVLLEGNVLPNEAFLTGLKEFLSGKDKRPLTDTVTVAAPAAVSYQLLCSYWVAKSKRDRLDEIKQRVQEAGLSYIRWQDGCIGRDINPDELIRQLLTAGAKRVTIRSPQFTPVLDTQIAAVSNFEIVYGGLEDD